VSEQPTRVRWRSLALDPECVLTWSARLAACVLCEDMGGADSRPCYVSMARIAARMGVTDRWARQAVRELEHEGFLVVEQRPGTTSLYRRALPPSSRSGVPLSSRSGATPEQTPEQTPERGSAELDNEITRGGKAPEKRPDKIAELRRRVGWET
jgi:hypothetical protein